MKCIKEYNYMLKTGYQDRNANKFCVQEKTDAWTRVGRVKEYECINKQEQNLFKFSFS